MKLKKYSKYKSSGIQWIGGVPEGWKVHRLKFMLSSLESGSRDSEDITPIEKGAFSLGGEHINWDGTLNLDNIRTVSREYYNSMNKGKIKINDVLLVKDGATIGKTALVKNKVYDKMAVNEHVFILRPNAKLNSSLLYYLISGDSGFTQIKLTESGSAQGGISSEFTGKVVFSITEDSREQGKIIDFLNSKTSKINQTIEKDKRLIELLKEKRTALINSAVTKGLNPNAKMKDSGIEWIDEIPENWEVRKLKFCAIINKKSLPENTNLNYQINYLDISNVDENGNIINFEEQYFEDAPSRARRIPQKGDTILSTVRTYLKAIAYLNNVPNNTIVSTGFAVLEPGQDINSKYLFYAVSSEVFIQSVIAGSVGVAYPAINPSVLSQLFLTLPPKFEEQLQIVQYLDKATSKIDETIQKIEKKIELLEEFKKSLIHYVVTGKVDVRGTVA